MGARVDEAEFARMYHAGYGPHEIAAALGINVGSTRHIRKRLGLPPFRNKPRIQKKVFDRARFLELYKADMTAKEIAEEMGFDQGTVNRHRKAMGLPLCRQPIVTGGFNRGGSKPKHDRELFRTLAESGYTNTQLSNAMGIPVKSVPRIRRELGISKAPPPSPYPPEYRERAETMLGDGASKKEVCETLGIAEGTLRRWFPDAKGWTPRQSVEYRNMKRVLDKLDNPAMPKQQWGSTHNWREYHDA